jgi:hypothetical protein
MMQEQDKICMHFSRYSAWYGLDGQGSNPGRGKVISLLQNVETSSGAHTAYLMSTGGDFSGVKRAGA